MQQEKRTLFGWKTAIGIIVGLFVSGMVTVVITTSYLDDRAAEKFYNKTSGVVLEQKVEVIEERMVRQEQKMDTIDNQQTQILLKLGEVNGKLDHLRK